LVAKPSHSWCRIYFHVMQNCFGLEATDFINDGKPIELEDDEKYEMKKLANWLFKQQISYLKGDL